MTIPDSVKGFAYEAKYWLEFADKLIRRFVIMVATWFGLTALSLAWNLKGLPGHSLAPFLAFVPSLVLTIVAIYLSVRLANLFTAAALLISWVRRKVEKLVAIFAGIYITTFLIGLLIAMHFWDIPSPGRFALIALAIPIAISFILAATLRTRWVTPILIAAGITILSLLTFVNGKLEWPDVWKWFGSQHPQTATIQPKADTNVPAHQEQGRAPTLTPPARPLEPESLATAEVFSRDNYHPYQFFGPDGQQTTFEYAAFRYRQYTATLPVGYWVLMDGPTLWNASWQAHPADGKPCTRYYVKPIRKGHPEVDLPPIGPIKWCDDSPSGYTHMDNSAFWIQAVQPDETIVFTATNPNIPDGPIFVTVATQPAQIVNPFHEIPTIKDFPNLPCTDEVRHMNSSGEAKTAKVNFGITADGVITGVAIIESTGIPALDLKVKQFVGSYTSDPVIRDGFKVPTPLVEAEVHIPANCHKE
jgi:hypothetical protein